MIITNREHPVSKDGDESQFRVSGHPQGESEDAMAVRPWGFIIVGLGNPGKEYEQTRHNVGFMVVDQIVKDKGHYWHTWEKHNTKESYPPTLKHLFVKPQTFMNRSGDAVKKVIGEYKYGNKLNRLWVIHDDLDLPLGTVRIKDSGSGAGHNGVQSIIDALGSDQFWRIRIGIGRPKNVILRNDSNEGSPRDLRDSSAIPQNDTLISNYVLSPFDDEEKPLLGKVIEQTAHKILSNLEKKSIVGETIKINS